MNHGGHDVPAYGLWTMVFINSSILIFFAFNFFRPKTKRDWRTLNLLPVGQIDGGHVAHALFSMVLLGLFVWSGLLFWALVVYFIAGAREFPPVDDTTQLNGNCRGLGWLAFGLLALILLPVPHALSPAFGLHCPYL